MQIRVNKTEVGVSIFNKQNKSNLCIGGPVLYVVRSVYGFSLYATFINVHLGNNVSQLTCIECKSPIDSDTNQLNWTSIVELSCKWGLRRVSDEVASVMRVSVKRRARRHDRTRGRGSQRHGKMLTVNAISFVINWRL